MTMPREDKVRELMFAANEGMQQIADTATAAEVFSAYFTLAACAIETARRLGVPVAAIRDAISELWLWCPEEKEKVN